MILDNISERFSVIFYYSLPLIVMIISSIRLSCIFGKGQQGVHDLLARTRVISEFTENPPPAFNKKWFIYASFALFTINLIWFTTGSFYSNQYSDSKSLKKRLKNSSALNLNKLSQSMPNGSMYIDFSRPANLIFSPKEEIISIERTTLEISDADRRRGISTHKIRSYEIPVKSHGINSINFKESVAKFINTNLESKNHPFIMNFKFEFKNSIFEISHNNSYLVLTNSNGIIIIVDYISDNMKDRINFGIIGFSSFKFPYPK